MTQIQKNQNSSTAGTFELSSRILENSKLGRALKAISQEGVHVYADYLCCGTCAGSSIHEKHGNEPALFFSKQNTPKKSGEILYLSHNGQETPEIAKRIFELVGFSVEWDGNYDNCLSVEVKPRDLKKP